MLASAGGSAIDHVAVAVESIAASRAVYELLTGRRCSPPQELADQGVRVAFVGGFELVEPLAPDTHVARFLSRRGPGLHHVALRTADLRGELDRLHGEGVRLIDREPRRGARGHLVAFVHPSATGGVLVELVEHSVEDREGA